MFERKSVCLRGHPRNRTTVYASGHCKQCQTKHQSVYNSNNPKRKAWCKNYYIKKRFGISYDEYKLKLMQQQGKCMICQDSSRVVLDHNHTTGKVRAFLCSNCNTVIGMAKESQEILRAAAGYLKFFE